MKINSLHIEGRRGFQKTYGNTYNSVILHINGAPVAYLPEEYGYENYYLQRAQEWLGANGVPELAEKRSNGVPKVNFTIWLRDNGYSYSVSDVKRQLDL